MTRDQLLILRPAGTPDGHLPCVHCERWLPADSFRPDKSWYGRHSWCRECMAEAVRQSRARKAASDG